MLKIILEKWNKNKDKLKEVFETQKGFNDCDYKDIVKTLFDIIYNDGAACISDKLDIENLTEIDNGDYQGTLLYLVPFTTINRASMNIL